MRTRLSARGAQPAVRVLVVLAGLAFLVLAYPGAAAADDAADGTDETTTVVSFTFAGTHPSQDDAALILAEHGMAGTFYVNAGYIGFPAYLSLDEVRAIARSRSEVGGASLYGNDLSQESVAAATAEVCDDRATLAQLGFQVTSFAYPHGASPPVVKQVVQDCGYNNARDYAGLYTSPTDCSFCPMGESLPPRDDFRIRTSTATTLAELELQVTRAESHGGGWVPLEFTNVCVCPAASGEHITPEDFTSFVTWLEARRDTTVVMTVDQVMGGALQPVHGDPMSRLVPDPSAAISTPRVLSKIPAWTLFGIGIGQSQIILVGVLVSVSVVLTYRLATRGDRYAH
ncbi:polysaccharide deacetylase family protein [Nocardioides rubriscoriae]|uniref:polysaccharide deacetylase family protein n=1 Tax=Nocardioides rubriscoriae TaxID=642762 RepID=UPI00147818CF|nr:polysaccharide deacetylase family protein [Nocardioides rubriscoriae]